MAAHIGALDLPAEADNAAAFQKALDDGVVRIGVFGDSLAEGLWGALYRKLQRDDRFEVLRRAQHSTGLARADYYDWPAALDQFLLEDDIDAAVFSIGLNDMQSFYAGGRRHYRFLSEEWDQAYAARVVELMERLREAEIPTFWIGLPIMRSGNYSRNIAHLNEIYEKAAEAVGVTYVPLWDVTADENGEYSSYLQDKDGRSRLMRANDGIHFTTRGYDMLADRVYEVMAAQLAIPQVGGN